MNKKVILLVVITVGVVGIGTYFDRHGSKSSYLIGSENSSDELGMLKIRDNLASSTSELNTSHSNPSVPAIKELQLEFAADFSDPKVLVGGSQYVFVAKIIRQVGTQTNIKWMPKTQFEAEIISNIKGDVQGKVVINQIGGYLDGVLYVVNDDLLGPADGPDMGRLLQIGSTYILPTRNVAGGDLYTVNSFPGAIKLINKDQSLATLQQKTLVEADSRYRELLESYPNEVLLSADIQHGYTQNSFQSLTVKQQTSIRDKIHLLSVPTASSGVQ